jgi:hypothetical protein
MVFSNSQPAPQQPVQQGSPAQQYEQGGFVNQPSAPVLPTQPAASPSDPAYSAGFDPDFVKFTEQFKRYAGVDFKEAVSEIQESRTFRQQQETRKQEKQLQQVWEVPDNEFEYRLNVVRDEWNKLPPAEQQKIMYRTGYDEIGAASIVWNSIQQREPSPNDVNSLFNQQQVQPQVPQLDRNSAVPGAQQKQQSRFKFTQSQIDQMSQEDYSRNADAIAQAYATGQVYRDLY